MTLPPSQKIDTHLGTILKASTVILGLITFLGSVIFVIYCLHLDYFPSGVTAGDSLIFIILALCFGIIYSIVNLCLLSVGVCITYCLNIFILIYQFISLKLSFTQHTNTSSKPFRFVKPHIMHLLLFVIGIGFFLGFASQNWKSFIQLSGTVFLISLAWTLYKQTESKYDLLLNKTETETVLNQLKHLNQLKYMLLGFIYIAPIIFGGISLMTLEGGMKFSKLQKRDSYILVQPPYNLFIPEIYKVKDPKYIETGYTTFKDISVKLTGVGQKTIIQFSPEKGEPPQTFEIPNDKIIIVPAPK
jgi:hypothetical protein